MLPDGWREAKLNELGTINAQTLPENAPADFEFYYLDLSAVKEGKIDFPAETITYESAPSRARRIVKDGDILLATVRPNLQGYALAKNLPHNTIGSTGFAVITAKPKADAAFIYQAISGGGVQAQIQALVVGSNYPAINGSDVKNLSILTPPLSEQKRIAEVLGSVDEAIGATKAVIDQTKTVKQGLLQTLLTRGIGHTKFKDSPLGEIPETWGVVKLDDVAKRGSGHTPSKQVPQYWDGGIKWVSLRDSSALDNLYLSETAASISTLGIENSSAVLHPPGTVVLSRDAGVGKSAIITDEMAVSQHFMAWHCGKSLDNHFLYFTLQLMKPDFENIAAGSTIKTIGLDYFKKLQIRIPPISEQQQISCVLLNAEQFLKSETEKLTALQTLKKGLMNDLLTGKVHVNA